MSNNTPNKILICIPFFTLGGAETQALLLADYLKNTLKVDVEVIAFKKKNGLLCGLLDNKKIPYHIYNVDLSVFHEKGLKKIYILIKFGLFLRKRKYDYILPFTYYPNLLCNLTRILSGIKKCYWNQRGMESIGFSKLEKLTAGMSLNYIGNSQACLDFVYNRHQVKNRKGVLVKNAVKQILPAFTPDEWRRKLLISKEYTIVTCVANFYPEKDHQTLIKAIYYLINELKTSNPLKLVLVGYVIQESILNKIKAMVLDYKLYNDVIFLESCDDISGLLQITDIGVLTSVSEGSPNAILEYMINKLPVIATAIPSIIEIFGKNTEFLFPVGEERIMAQQLKKLIEDNSLRVTVGNENYRIAINEYAPEKMLKAYKELMSL